MKPYHITPDPILFRNDVDAVVELVVLILVSEPTDWVVLSETTNDKREVTEISPPQPT